MQGKPIFLLWTLILCALPAVAVIPLTPSQLSHETIHVAAVQMTGNWVWQGNDDAPKETVDAVVEYIDRAGADGRDLIVFPELLLGKFAVPSLSTERIAESARKNNINVVVGCFEILDAEGNFGNSALIFNRQGEIVGRSFKTHPAVGESPFLWPPRPDDAEQIMVPGPDFPVFDLDFGRIGIITCYDGYFPEPARILALKGAEIILWMSAHAGIVEDYIVKTNMHQNYVHMICTNKAFGAGTCIAQWPNTIIASCGERDEAYISGTLHTAHLRYTRKHAREFHQRRPEIYGEIARESPVWEYYANLPERPEVTGHWAEVRPVVIETPVLPKDGMGEGVPLSPLAVELRAPWMDGWITLRFPETMSAAFGCIFMDHYRTDIQPASPLEPWPAWGRDAKTGTWRYEHSIPKKLRFAASAQPYHDTVYLEFSMENLGEEPIAFVEANACLNMAGCPILAEPWGLSRIFTFIDGEFTPLSETTPTPDDKGRPPWITMRAKNAFREYTGPKDTETWWLLEQTADMNLMAVISKDNAHMVAYAWDVSPELLMSNTGNPCLHTGPAPVEQLMPGETVSRRGAVYLIKNDPEVLRERYRRDSASWLRWPRRPVE